MVRRGLFLKKAVVVIAAAFILIASPAGIKFGLFGTTPASGEEPRTLNVTDAIELMQADMTAHKKNIVARSMEMTESQSKVFWPLFKEYQTESEKLNNRTMKLVENFLKHQKTLSDAEAKKLLQEFISIEGDQLALKKKYIEKFSKAMPSRLVLKYFQLENKMEAAFRWAFADEIPLVR
jgi:hypothetical protein